jgi:hypothetical protein
MKNTITKINSTFDLAVVFFLFSGSLFFVFNSIIANKQIYLLFSLLIYIASLIVRKVITKSEKNRGFTEIGLLFISPLFLAYLLALLNIDSSVRNYLPDKLLAGSWVSFLFLIVIHILTPDNKTITKFVYILIIVFILFLYYFFGSNINIFFQQYPVLSEIAIGTPLVYLSMVLFGIKSKNTKNV